MSAEPFTVPDRAAFPEFRASALLEAAPAPWPDRLAGDGSRKAQMLRWSLITLVVAVVATGLEFGGITGEADLIAKALPFVFLIPLVVAPVLGRKGLSGACESGHRL